MCRIGGRLRCCVARRSLVVLEIPPFAYLEPNPLYAETVLGG